MQDWVNKQRIRTEFNKRLLKIAEMMQFKQLLIKQRSFYQWVSFHDRL